MRINLIDIKRMSLLSCSFYSLQFEWLPMFTKILTIFLVDEDIFHLICQ